MILKKVTIECKIEREQPLSTHKKTTWYFLGIPIKVETVKKERYV